MTETINNCMPPSNVTVPLPIGNTSGGGGVNQTAKEVNNCAALSGGLGALAALMTLGVVGVVLGWAWSCQRRRKYYGNQDSYGNYSNTSGIIIVPCNETVQPKWMKIPAMQLHLFSLRKYICVPDNKPCYYCVYTIQHD